MIAEHLEPKGLDRNTPGIPSSYPIKSRIRAERGSAELLEALRRSGVRP